jgi:FkbM family methyltransferase
MRTIKIAAPNSYSMNVPEWFMLNRGDGGITFEKLQIDGSIQEIGTYKNMRLFMKNFPSDSIFLDVGAQIGLSSLPVASEGYSVIAVEPVTRNIEILKENIEMNKYDIRIAEIAAYRENTDIEIFIPSEEDCASISKTSASIGTSLSSETVKAMRIDDWLAENSVDTSKIRVVKIDVQGAEEHVLDGMEKLLQNSNLCIIIEWDVRMMQNMGTDSDSLLKKIQSLGFEIYRWDHSDLLFKKGDFI